MTRCAYRQRGHANLHPIDGQLNLPGERVGPPPAQDGVGTETNEQDRGEQRAQLVCLASAAAADHRSFRSRQIAQT